MKVPVNKIAFGRSDFLIPCGIEMEKWAVIACDQYTSDKTYWESVNSIVAKTPSTLGLILPEVYLDKNCSKRVEEINKKMQEYLASDILKEYKNCYIYIERRLSSGVVRSGIVGVADMECYSYIEGAQCLIKPTEKTVQERIPPRKEVRDNAKMELSHVILFCNDESNSLIGFFASKKNIMKELYEFDLMKNGGNIRGWLVEGDIAEEFENRYEKYCVLMDKKNIPQLIVGDGNHSLATAKAVYEDNKYNQKSRYAMVELQNIYDDAIVFEPIHRVLYDIDIKKFLGYVAEKSKGSYPIQWVTQNSSGCIKIDVKDDQIPVEVLQPIIDEYLSANIGGVDYVHDGVEKMVNENENSLGLLLPSISKTDIFKRIANKGVYPRKTFSVGLADDKRFYLESRVIK